MNEPLASAVAGENEDARVWQQAVGSGESIPKHAHHFRLLPVKSRGHGRHCGDLASRRWWALG